MFGKRVGFVKFKADIIDEETKAKVIEMLLPPFPALFLLKRWIICSLLY
jgi:ADP-sugar diphosphatase